MKKFWNYKNYPYLCIGNNNDSNRPDGFPVNYYVLLWHRLFQEF